MRIGVVDYEAGNLKSVETALSFLEADYFVSKNPANLLTSDRLIFPGVGEAAAAMNILTATGLGEAIKSFFKSGKLILGICLGSHIVLSHSEESDTSCLDIVKGRAVRFPQKTGFKVPHMGWNQVQPLVRHELFAGIPDRSSFYFVHSYYPKTDAAHCSLATTDYMISFTSVINFQNLFAAQFHPEKSGKYGLRLLDNFLKMKES